MNASCAGRLLLGLLALSGALPAAPDALAPVVNALGLDLYRERIKSADGGGVLLSPYSISSALAMTYVGADGVTRDEMRKVLRFPQNQDACAAEFQDLAKQLRDVVHASERDAAEIRKQGGEATPLELSVANRVFVQRGYALRSGFVATMNERFGAPLAELDFRGDPTHAGKVINEWIADRTRGRIRDFLPPGQPNADARLTLVNALYLRAAWLNEFSRYSTQPERFYLIGAPPADVPTMRARQRFGYAARKGYSVVSVPYETGQLQCVLLIPDQRDGLPQLEKGITASALAECADLTKRDVFLHLPKFNLEPETLPLASALQGLGLRTAFDIPAGSANFDRIAPRKRDDYLAIGSVLHKTWLSLDEQGTEAAATTTVEVLTLGASAKRKEPPPIEVRADRPFMFAIQHVPSGVCLFLGRVTDPR